MTDSSNNQQPLPPGYEFQDEKLRVERVLGIGGFGITYLVRDLHVDDYRVLKENFPKNLSLRASGSVVSLVSSNNQDDYDYLLNRFIFESEQLQRFSGHPNIANVVGSFRANNTAYMLMSYRPGKTLAEHIQQNDNRPLSEDEIKLLCLPVLKGLQAMHAANLLHLDIKPENIYIPSLGEPYLIDFGGARHFSSTESQRLSQYSSMVRTPGYAPPEQSSTQKQHQAATDLYAFGATLYYAISSQVPIDANDRRAAIDDDEADPLSLALDIGAGRYSPELLQAIDACLRIKRKDRPQSVVALLQLLPASWRVTEPFIHKPVVQPPPPEPETQKTQPEPEPAKPGPKPESSAAKSNKSWLWLATIAVLVAASWWGYGYLDEQSKLAADQSNWQLANSMPSFASYQAYLDGCSSTCQYRRVARERMEQLREFELTIRSNVGANEVWIDGRSYGSTPVNARLTRGSYAVRVSKAGYQDYFERIEFRQSRTLRVEMERELAPGDIIQDCPECPKMVYIPAGSFRMGDIQGGLGDDAKPVHRVSVKAFFMSQTEVTFAEWDACVAAGGCSHKPRDRGWGRNRRPTINVSWEDITDQYIPWLNRTTGEQYRLPSEAEWEYAARADSETKYSWSNGVGNNIANCDGCGSRWDSSGTAPVASFAANAFGLYDMHGNVSEWVQDCWNYGYKGAPTDGSAWLSDVCDLRVYRGGSWYSHPIRLRSSDRGSTLIYGRSDLTGFRLARTLD